MDVLEALCDFFNVSSDYLLGKDDVTIRFVSEEDLKKLDSDGEYYIDEETAKLAQEIFSDPDKRALFEASADCPPEYLRIASDMLRRLKETNKDG